MKDQIKKQKKDQDPTAGLIKTADWNSIKSNLKKAGYEEESEMFHTFHMTITLSRIFIRKYDNYEANESVRSEEEKKKAWHELCDLKRSAELEAFKLIRMLTSYTEFPFLKK